MTAAEPGGRHHANRVPMPWYRRRPRMVWRNRTYVRMFVSRLALTVALLIAAAAGGGVGLLAAPLIRQPRDAAFWGGVVVFFVLYSLAFAVVVIGSACRVPSLLRWRDRLEWLA